MSCAVACDCRRTFSEIKIKLKFDAGAAAPNFEADFNMPPTALMLVAIRSQDGKRTPKMMKWGLIPHWAKDDKIQYSTHNARSEEFTTKAAFRDAWKCGQRCLLVHNGFYEWKKIDEKGKKKQAYAIDMADGSPMVTAGLWSLWKSPQSGEEMLTCTMMTARRRKSWASFTTGCPSFSPSGIGRNGSVKNWRPSKNSWRCSSHARMTP